MTNHQIKVASQDIVWLVVQRCVIGEWLLTFKLVIILLKGASSVSFHTNSIKIMLSQSRTFNPFAANQMKPEQNRLTGGLAAASTYGINMVLKSNTAKQDSLTLRGRTQPAPSSSLWPPPNMQLVINAPAEIIEREPLSETESKDTEELEAKSKCIKKTRQKKQPRHPYKICHIQGCNRSYYSEKRYKRHLIDHLKKVMRKMTIPAMN